MNSHRKIAVKCNSHHRQGGSISADRKPWIDFEKTCSTDLFCNSLPRKKHNCNAAVLFSVKFALRASEIATLCNICFANVDKFHFTSTKAARDVRYFKISARKLLHIRQRRIFRLKKPRSYVNIIHRLIRS